MLFDIEHLGFFGLSDLTLKLFPGKTEVNNRLIIIHPVEIEPDYIEEGTSMAIAWTEDLAVGFEEIDNQHKELFRRIDQLLDACTHGRGKEAVIDVVKFLENYVVTHFKNEDDLMTKYNYPDRLSHLEQHRQFISNFQELKQKIETDGVAAYTVILTNRVVVGWLNDHIRKVDKVLGLYLKEQK